MKRRALALIPLSLLTLLLALLFSQQRNVIRPVQAATPAASVFFFLSDQTLGSGGNDIDAFIAATTADKVWLNQGGTQGGLEGHFANSGQNLGSNYSGAVALDDIDADGDLDAFVIDDGGTGAVWINQGGDQGGTAGQFLIGQSITETLASDVAMADLNGDNSPDAFIARSVGRADKIWWNDGSGSFSDSGQNLGSNSSTGVALGDLDGDGDIDAFLSDGAANKVWTNQGGTQGGTEGIFSDSGQNLGNTLSNSVALGDVDGDSDLDAYVANINVDDVLWINQGGDQGGTAGQFSASPQQLAPAPSRDIKLLDLDGDSDLDAFVARAGGNQVWLNQGGDQGGALGIFANSGLDMGNAFSLAVDLADADGDGDLDAFVANTTSTNNEIWINGTTALPEAFFQVDRQTNASGKEVYYATASQASLPIVLSQPFTQTISIHSRVDAPGSVFTSTFPVPAGQQLKILDLVASQPNPADEYLLTLFVTLPGGSPAANDYTDKLSFFFVDASQGPASSTCLLCFGEWLGRLLGFNPVFGALHHVNLDQQKATAQWHYYTLLFDIHASELTNIAASYPAILWDLLGTMDQWTPAIQALGDGSGSDIIISQKMMDDSIELIEGIKAKASPSLSTALAHEQSAADLPSFAGLNMDEAWSAVIARRSIDELYITIIIE